MPELEPELAIEASVEAALDAYWLARAQGKPADVDAFARELPDESERALFRGRAIAQEYRGRLAAGERCPVDPFLAAVPEPAARAAFLAELHDAAAAERVLPGELPPGTVLDEQYEILEEIGRGGMGIVYGAWDLKLAREVAIKVLHRGAASNGPEDWERLALAESKSLAGVHSRHIVAIHDVRAKGARSYLVMERVRGLGLEEVIERLRDAEKAGTSQHERARTLRRILGESARPGEDDLIDDARWPRTVARIVRAIASALEAAHACGVLHRDLKPKNVILLGGGDPVVLDFGLAARRGAEPIEEDEGLHGTPQYLAPEQASSRRTGADVRIDVYQLGLVLYEMSTLAPAVDRQAGEGVAAFLARVAKGLDDAARARLSSVPRSLAAICAKATAAAPEDRYPSAAALRADLDRFLSGLPNHLARTSRAHEWSLRARWLSRRPLAIAAASVLVAAPAVRLVTAADWNPPAIAPWHLPYGAKRPEMLDRAESIRVSAGGHADPIGVTLESTRKTWIYAFSVFGSDEAEGLKIVPRTPELFDHLARTDPSRVQPLVVEPGTDDLVTCSWLSNPSPWEGLLVYAADAPSEWLETWQRRLLEIARTELRDVSYDEAMRELERIPGGGRGVGGEKIPDDERARAFRNLPRVRQHKEVLATAHIVRLDVLLPVERVEDGK